MTVSDLYKQVAGLGFETSLENDDRFIYAANRALLQVNALRPATKLYRLLHAPLENAADNDARDPVIKTESISFSAMGARSYYFECNGVGAAYVERRTDGGWEVLSFIELNSPNRSYVQYRGFIKKENRFLNDFIRIRFEGEHVYYVQNLALYRYTYSDKDEDIPAFSTYISYDISKLADNFLRLAPSAIIDEEEREIVSTDAYSENGRLVLISRYKAGPYLIRYLTRPKEITKSDSNDAIAMDEDLCALLPTLIASYIWAEDEPNLAEYYLNMYYKMAAETEARSRIIGTANITSNGW